jgi:small subunit ribosomal protein S3
MSVVKRVIQDSIERVKVDELLSEEYEQAGYGGLTLTKTPLGAQINLFAMRPGRVIGKRGRAIKEASEKLEVQLGLSNPQITVVEVEVPELNPRIMAARIANTLERGVHFRRAIFWSLRRIMESGAMGCEIILKGPLRSSRSRYEKVVEGYVPKSGHPAQKFVKIATMHVKMKRGTLGVTVKIVPPDAKFPDKVDLSGLPELDIKPPISEAQIEAVDVPITESPDIEPKLEPDTSVSLVEESASESTSEVTDALESDTKPEPVSNIENEDPRKAEVELESSEEKKGD